MTKREMTSLVLKLVGIYIVVRYIGYFPMILSPLITMRMGEPSNLTAWFYALATMLSLLIYPVFCIFIIICSNRLARWLIREDDTVELPVSISKDDIMTIAFCCIGLVIMAGAIPQLANIVTNYILLKAMPEYADMGRFRIDRQARFAGALVKFILGLLLFLRSKGLVGLWHKIRG